MAASPARITRSQLHTIGVRTLKLTGRAADDYSKTVVRRALRATLAENAKCDKTLVPALAIREAKGNVSWDAFPLNASAAQNTFDMIASRLTPDVRAKYAKAIKDETNVVVK